MSKLTSKLKPNLNLNVDCQLTLRAKHFKTKYYFGELTSACWFAWDWRRQDSAYQLFLFATSCSCVPVSTISPSRMTRMRLHLWTLVNRCATITAVAPSCTRFITAWVTRFSVLASRLEVASSIRRTPWREEGRCWLRWVDTLYSNEQVYRAALLSAGTELVLNYWASTEQVLS